MDSDRQRETLQITEINGQAWTYTQKTGELEHDGEPIGTGYSGCGEGKNNPEMQSVHNIGPVPKGNWTISGPPVNTPQHGPYVLRLTPRSETETFGRSGFLIHGDSKAAPGTASQGCIILARPMREKVWESGDRDLEVVAELPLTSDEKK
ncbi:MAG TPA: tlde1 domain-containing protein [Candidatus Sulfotelmatobacter sp.]|nr:tlde1 domain-containing protein [Candidatus Sulfotelmatobacter sp.]